MEPSAISILQDFYIAARTSEAWNESTWREISNNQSIYETCVCDDDTIYEILNKCIMSDISSAQVRWWLKLDLESIHRLTVSKCSQERLRIELMDECPDIFLSPCMEE